MDEKIKQGNLPTSSHAMNEVELQVKLESIDCMVEHITLSFNFMTNLPRRKDEAKLGGVGSYVKTRKRARASPPPAIRDLLLPDLVSLSDRQLQTPNYSGQL